MIRIATILMCAGSFCSGQGFPPNQRTDGLHNGRFWLATPQNYKGVYVSGFMDSLVLCRVADLSAEKKPDDNQSSLIASMLTSTATIGESVESLDNFYSEPANRPIPIAFAMNWVQMKRNGTSEAVLKEYETKLRVTVAQ